MAKHRVKFSPEELQNVGSGVPDQRFAVSDERLQKFIDAVRMHTIEYRTVCKMTTEEKLDCQRKLGLAKFVPSATRNVRIHLEGRQADDQQALQLELFPMQVLMMRIGDGILAEFADDLYAAVFEIVCASADAAFPNESEVNRELIAEILPNLVAVSRHLDAPVTSSSFDTDMCLYRHILNSILTETTREAWINCCEYERSFVHTNCKIIAGASNDIFMAPIRLIKGFNDGRDVIEESLDYIAEHREKWFGEVLNYVNARIDSDPNIGENERLTAKAGGYQAANAWFDMRIERLEKEKAAAAAEAKAAFESSQSKATVGESSTKQISKFGSKRKNKVS